MFATSSPAISWSTVSLSNSRSSSSYGGQSSNFVMPDDSKDPDEVEKPSTPSVMKITETGIQVVHESNVRSISSQLIQQIQMHGKIEAQDNYLLNAKKALLKLGRVLLNALLYPGITTNLQKNSIVAIFNTADDWSDNTRVVARTFLIRTKTEEDRDKLEAAIQEYAPVA